jgi:hypothetical protein
MSAKNAGRQFIVRLHQRDGEYMNFLEYKIDKVLETARLVQRFDLGEQHCVLVFEELPKRRSGPGGRSREPRATS